MGKPRVLASRLDNPLSPRVVGRYLVFSQSGRGEVSRIPLRGGTPKRLIGGFGFDSFAGYRISAEGIAIEPGTREWIVAAAAGRGTVLRFDPREFPTAAANGRPIPIEGGDDDNPFGVVFAGGPLVVSSGTRKAYRRPGGDELSPLRPVLAVSSGVIGLAYDPRSRRVDAAIYGRGPGTGKIVSWDPAARRARTTVVAAGLTNPVDVALTPTGKLLVLQFGRPGKRNGLLGVVTSSRHVRPLLRGLANPAGLTVGPDGTVYIAQFGTPPNGRRGSIVAVRLGSRLGAS